MAAYLPSDSQMDTDMVLSPKRILGAGGATLVAGVAALAFSGSSATAASTTVSSSGASANWAGYVAQGNTFSSVSGSWVAPSVKCTANSTYSAFWVGLGGASDQSQGLEQVGTQADCNAGGATSYYAWYELVPAAPVKLDLAVKPGDHITGKVTVNATNVLVALTNASTGQSVSKSLQTTSIDTSSAEWIAEAPSACDNSGSCQPLSLANFGTVNFTNASATAGGHTGAITDSNWQTSVVALNGGAAGASEFGPRGVAYDPSGSASAQASGLSSNGSAFSVAWQSPGTASTSTDTQTGSGSGVSSGSSGSSGSGAGGSGYGPGSGYGYDPGYGYGSGYGSGSGYGYDPGYGSGSGYGYDPGYGYGYGNGYGYGGAYSGGGAAPGYGV